MCMWVGEGCSNFITGVMAPRLQISLFILQVVSFFSSHFLLLFFCVRGKKTAFIDSDKKVSLTFSLFLPGALTLGSGAREKRCQAGKLTHINPPTFLNGGEIYGPLLRLALPLLLHSFPRHNCIFAMRRERRVRAFVVTASKVQFFLSFLPRNFSFFSFSLLHVAPFVSAKSFFF